MLNCECASAADMITALMSFHGDNHVATTESVARYCHGESAIGQIHLAIVNGLPVGSAMTYDWPNLLRGLRIRHLELMFVKPQFRRLGLGRKFMGHLASEALAGGCAAITLSAALTNDGANSFYTSLGFSERSVQACAYAISGQALRNLAGFPGLDGQSPNDR